MDIFVARGAKCFNLRFGFIIRIYIMICGVSDELSVTVAFWLNVSERLSFSRECFFSSL